MQDLHRRSGTLGFGVCYVRKDFAFAFEGRKYVVSGEKLAGLLDSSH
jgi:hypothetical protein